MPNLEEVINWPDIPEACRRLEICHNSGYSWVWKNKLQAVKVCGRWRVNPEHIDQLRRERTAKRHRDDSREKK